MNQTTNYLLNYFKKEDRMKLLGKIALLCGALMMLATPAMAEKKVKWKLAMTWPSTLAPLITAPMQMAQMVSDMTGGNSVIRIEGKEKHKAPLGIVDMVKGGQYQMGHSASYYWKGKDIT